MVVKDAEQERKRLFSVLRANSSLKSNFSFKVYQFFCHPFHFYARSISTFKFLFAEKTIAPRLSIRVARRRETSGNQELKMVSSFALIFVANQSGPKSHFPHLRIQGAPLPPSFFTIMQFSGNFEQFLGSRPPWGQNSAAPHLAKILDPPLAPESEFRDLKCTQSFGFLPRKISCNFTRANFQRTPQQIS